MLISTHSSALFVNVPSDSGVYVFQLPEPVYMNFRAANEQRKENETTVSLKVAIDRITEDVHDDS